ncbi:MAG: 4Fe-4S binding protein [Oscillospiraceae bacterium]
MKYYEIVFSPTGGTKRCADILVSKLSPENTVIDLTGTRTDFSAIELSDEDFAVIAVPSYGGRVPFTASERIGQIKASGARCVLLCVYGNRAFEDTLTELEDVSVSAGFRPIAAATAIAEHSIARLVAAGRPDEADRAELEAFGVKIAEKLTEPYAGPVTVPGNRPYKEKKAGKGRAPKIDTEKCINCGTCADRCPVRAIDLHDVTRTDADKCISCMRCIAVCPVGARDMTVEEAAAVNERMMKICPVRRVNELFVGCSAD